MLIGLSRQKTVTIKRRTDTTRATLTTVASNVVMDIQPARGGVRGLDDEVVQTREKLFVAFPLKLNSVLKENDVIQRTGKKDLFVWRVDDHIQHQEILLTERANVP